MSFLPVFSFFVQFILWCSLFRLREAAGRRLQAGRAVGIFAPDRPEFVDFSPGDPCNLSIAATCPDEIVDSGFAQIVERFLNAQRFTRPDEVGIQSACGLRPALRQVVEDVLGQNRRTEPRRSRAPDDTDGVDVEAGGADTEPGVRSFDVHVFGRSAVLRSLLRFHCDLAGVCHGAQQILPVDPGNGNVHGSLRC